MLVRYNEEIDEDIQRDFIDYYIGATFLSSVPTSLDIRYIYKVEMEKKCKQRFDEYRYEEKGVEEVLGDYLQYDLLNLMSVEAIEDLLTRMSLHFINQYGEVVNSPYRSIC